MEACCFCVFVTLSNLGSFIEMLRKQNTSYRGSRSFETVGSRCECTCSKFYTPILENALVPVCSSALLRVSGVANEGGPVSVAGDNSLLFMSTGAESKPLEKKYGLVNVCAA